MRTEPVLLMALVNAVIGLLVSFQWIHPITPAQLGAINAVVAGIVGLIARSFVSPVG